MANIIYMNLKRQKFGKIEKAQIFEFLQKLAHDETSGLNIEKIQNSVDSRARTARVNKNLRAVLYQIDSVRRERTYIYAGTWPHDEGIQRAKSRTLSLNPVTGIPEFLEQELSHLQQTAVPRSFEPSSRQIKYSEPSAIGHPSSAIDFLGYSLDEIHKKFGFDELLLQKLSSFQTPDQMLDFSDLLEDRIQGLIIMHLSMGEESVDAIKARLEVNATSIETNQESLQLPELEADFLLNALESPIAKYQYKLLDMSAESEDLQDALDGAGVSAWRWHLHPSQRKYVEQNHKGAFKLSGAAGSGKTAVLLHRAKRFYELNPKRRVLITTFTTSLVAKIRADLRQLDLKLKIVDSINQSGIAVIGIDSIANRVLKNIGSELPRFSQIALGYKLQSTEGIIDDTQGLAYWEKAIQNSEQVLTGSLAGKTGKIFFAEEYGNVILANRITSVEQYLTIARPGRGVSLNRSVRSVVWKVIEEYRKICESVGKLTYSDRAELAAAWSEHQARQGKFIADSVLVDEVHNFSPSHWKLLRALVNEGENDIFVAEDTHQRTLNTSVSSSLGRYGIHIVGRSQRLNLSYRSTLQILNFAMKIHTIDEHELVNVEEGKTLEYFANRTGVNPILIAANTELDFQNQIATLLKLWLTQVEFPSSEIAIAARTHQQLDQAKEFLALHDIKTYRQKYDQSNGTGIPLITLNSIQGQEFSRILLYDVSSTELPNRAAMESNPLEDRAGVSDSERRLLYIGATRARDELAVSWLGKPTVFLNEAIASIDDDN